MAIAASLVVGIGPAAANLECGAVITQSTTLTHDLVDCPGIAIKIGASNIVFDLGGHTIDGVAMANTIGVSTDTYDGVTVRNGKIQQFSRGVFVSHGSVGSTVSGLTVVEGLVNVGAGIFIDGLSSGAKVVGNVMMGGSDGIAAHGASSVIQNNQVHNAGVGVLVGELASQNTLKANIISGAQLGFWIKGDGTVLNYNQATKNGTGIHVGSQATNTTVSVNQLSSNGQDGLLVEPAATATLLDGNIATKNVDDGIDVDSASTTIKGNSAHVNGDHGIEAVPGVTDGGGNKATGNGSANCVNVLCT